jgi:uncharacterized protein (PEP-CTERM system associated)
MKRGSLVLLVLAGLLIGSGRAAAQGSNFVAPATADPQAAAGWSLTPSIGYSGSWDDNVLIRGKGDETTADFLSMINPRGTVNFNGRRSQVSASYDGAFVLYRELSSLNSYDQRGSLYAERLLSPHVALFVRSSLAKAPTTELTAFIGVPFVRNGSRIADTRGGANLGLSKRATATISYDVQWVDFDHSTPGSEALQGGHSQGGSASLRYILDSRATLIGDYEITHAIIVANGEAFDIQNTWVGADYKLSEETRIFGAGGLSRLGVTQFSEARIGPALRAGLLHKFRTLGVDVQYSRSFVPAYGFGGTMQNEELSGRLRLPLARRVSASSGVAWRRNDPLTQIDPPLRSLWIEGSIGYAATPRVRIEAFFAGTRQTIDRPGGETDRNRVGFQVITAKPMRIR